MEPALRTKSVASGKSLSLFVPLGCFCFCFYLQSEDNRNGPSCCAILDLVVGDTQLCGCNIQMHTDFKVLSKYCYVLIE